MALLTYFPHNQQFGINFNNLDHLLKIPRRQELSQRSGVSEVENDANKFEVKLDCSHFKHEEITVKTVDDSLIIHCKHEEKTRMGQS